ncbi:MAG TPA: hypothetical protein VN688_23815 [Gemmataceae bacterium]|nr:hypothetical protein [Gemmataceae bacterium]
MTYKVLYHQGEAVSLKTKARVGRLSLEGDRLLIHGEPGVSVPLEALQSVELYRLHGTGRMLKIRHEGGTLFVSVIRFSLFGLFAVVNFFATGRLHEELEAAMG